MIKIKDLLEIKVKPRPNWYPLEDPAKLKRGDELTDEEGGVYVFEAGAPFIDKEQLKVLKKYDYMGLIGDLEDSPDLFGVDDNTYIVAAVDWDAEMEGRPVHGVYLYGNVEGGIYKLLTRNQTSVQETVDLVPGGLAKNKTLEDLAKKYRTTTLEAGTKLAKGMDIEKEHTDSKTIAKEIAMDHLWEDLQYYTKLNKIEKH